MHGLTEQQYRDNMSRAYSGGKEDAQDKLRSLRLQLAEAEQERDNALGEMANMRFRLKQAQDELAGACADLHRANREAAAWREVVMAVESRRVNAER